jgi:hypothetical protein
MTQMNIQSKSEKNTEKAALFVAVALTVIWVLGIAAIFIIYPDVAREISYDQNLTTLVAVGLFLPLALIWMAALLARSLSTMRNEATDLRKSVERMRQTLDERVGEETETRDKWIQAQLAQISTLTQQTDNRVSELALKTLEDRGQVPEPRNTTALSKRIMVLADDAQADLPLPSEDKMSDIPITIRELIKALNFPDDANDTEGFRVLRRAFNDRTTSKLLQSAQAVLTMLSEDGIFTDDLRVENPAASAWRSFAKGERGKDVAALGMVRDRTALSLSNTRLKNDVAFRETVHVFLTQFDAILSEFEETAEDNELVEMGKTRSAIAFMLLGRISGAFNER